MLFTDTFSCLIFQPDTMLRQACHCGPELWQLRDTRNQTFHLLLLGAGCNSIIQKWIALLNVGKFSRTIHSVVITLPYVLKHYRLDCIWVSLTDDGSADSILICVCTLLGPRTNGFAYCSVIRDYDATHDNPTKKRFIRTRLLYFIYSLSPKPLLHRSLLIANRRKDSSRTNVATSLSCGLVAYDASNSRDPSGLSR